MNYKKVFNMKENCKYCGFSQSVEEWMSRVGYYDHKKTSYLDSRQFVECPICEKILHIDYDLICINEETN